MQIDAPTAPTSAGSRETPWRLRRISGVARLLYPWNLFWDQRHVVSTLVRSQIARRHRRSLLGWTWNVIQPGSQAVLLYFATRSAIRIPETSAPLAGFGTFFAAFIIAQGMGEIISRGPTLVAERAAWVKGSLFPLELLAPTAVGVSLYRIIPGGLLGVAAVTVSGGLAPGFTVLLAFLVGLAIAVVWATTLALALAAIGVYLRDAILAAPILTLGAIFVSPLYVSPSAGGLASLAVNLNPLTLPMNLVLSGLQWIPDNPVAFALGITAALVSLWLAATAFRRLSANFSDYV